jgi:hypothetical protein
VPWIFPTGCDAASHKLCDKPTSTTDERGHTTDYVYDPAHGGVLSETQPAPADGAARPQTRYSYAQLFAGVRNAAGTIVNAEAPVWLLVQESRCRTGSSCSGTAEEIRTLYHYGASGTANALRLRGTTVTGDGVTARTCYGYDPLGNRISETGPGGAPAACP